MSSSGKRQRDRKLPDQNGREKRRNQFSGDPREQDQPTPDDTTYRFLCPESQVGNIIGKGGSIVKSLRRETGAKIRVIDIAYDASQRIILIWSSKDGVNEEMTGDDKVYVAPAQAALFKVHTRIIEGEKGEVSARLLVPSVQIGCLLGKGGKIIQKIRAETGAQIRIVPREQCPTYVPPSDELVQISGDKKVVDKALYEISTRLHKSPLSERSHGAFLPSEHVVPSGGPLSTGTLLPPRNSLYGSGSLGFEPLGSGLPHSHGYGSYGDLDFGYSLPRASNIPVPPHVNAAPRYSGNATKEQEFCIRLVCQNDKVGYIIGKGGNAVRQLQESTGARIKVEDPIPDASERAISVSAHEYLNDQLSPVIEAILQLQSKVGDISKGSDGTFKTTLLVPSKQVGCLLGRKGSIIAELRKITNATINVTHKGLPKCAQETDELVEITGDKNTAQIALVEILKRLRKKAFNLEVEDGKFDDELLGPYLPSSSMFASFPVSSIADRYERNSPGRMHSSTGIGSGFGVRGARYPTTFGDPESWQGLGSGYQTPLSYSGGLQTGPLAGDGYRF